MTVEARYIDVDWCFHVSCTCRLCSRQSPVSMKSMMQAVWLTTVAFGNVLVVIIAASQFFDSQVTTTGHFKFPALYYMYLNKIEEFRGDLVVYM